MEGESSTGPNPPHLPTTKRRILSLQKNKMPNFTPPHNPMHDAISARLTHPSFQLFSNAVKMARLSGRSVFLGMKYVPMQPIQFAEFYMEVNGKLSIKFLPWNAYGNIRIDLSRLEAMSHEEYYWARMYPAQTQTGFSGSASVQYQTQPNQANHGAQVTTSTSVTAGRRISRDGAARYSNAPVAQPPPKKRASIRRTRRPSQDLPPQHRTCDYPGCNFVSVAQSEDNARQCIARHKLKHRDDPIVYVCTGPNGCMLRYSRLDALSRHIAQAGCNGLRKQMLASEFEKLSGEMGQRPRRGVEMNTGAMYPVSRAVF